MGHSVQPLLGPTWVCSSLAVSPLLSHTLPFTLATLSLWAQEPATDSARLQLQRSSTPSYCASWSLRLQCTQRQNQTTSSLWPSALASLWVALRLAPSQVVPSIPLSRLASHRL